jgi:hypothetical protein
MGEAHLLDFETKPMADPTERNDSSVGERNTATKATL